MPEALVVGRVALDLYPEQADRALEDVDSFRQYPGGFATNVATALARLGVRPAVFSAVGDDGHGRYLRRFLESEGIDCTWLGTHPELRTALAFCEIWPPDHFPITFHRTPTCPDWEIAPGDVDLEVAARAPLVYLSGTALAVEPSRSAVLAVAGARTGRTGHTIFDLDWRPALWRSAGEFPPVAADVARSATTILGGDAEWAASGLDPAAPSDAARVVKHGPDGATVYRPDGSVHHEPVCPVPVVNGLGAGDAFAAGWGYALLRGGDPARTAAANGAITAGRHSCALAMATEDELRRFMTTGRLEPQARAGGASGPRARGGAGPGSAAARANGAGAAWTPARARAVDEIAGPDGIVVGAAVDHRDSLALTMRRRGLPDPTPEQLTELKLRVAAALAPAASVVLLDAEHSAAQALAAGALPGDTALVVPLEAQGYADEGDLRLTSFLPDWDPAKAAALGASGCKLLLPFRPDVDAQRGPQAETAARAADACHDAGIALVLEPIVFARPGEELAAERFAELVVRTAAELREVGPDILKMQYPGDAAACRALDDACGPAVPWVLLGGGADAETLEAQIADACAHGASGFIVGRTLFDAALVDDDEASRAALLDVSRPLLERLAATARAAATPWRARVGSLPPPARAWYR